MMMNKKRETTQKMMGNSYTTIYSPSLSFIIRLNSRERRGPEKAQQRFVLGRRRRRRRRERNAPTRGRQIIAL
jgi:hypothetical protein